jgi:hypothetical protein
MADIKQIQVNGTTYDIKDEVARQQLATKQDTITAVVNPVVVETGGSPSASVDFSNGELAFSFKNLKGNTGQRGDTVILGDEQEYTLYSGRGDNSDGAMTQEAVTDELTVVVKTYNPTTWGSTNNAGNIYDTKWRTPKTVGGNDAYGDGRIKDVTSLQGKTLRITPQEGKSAYFAFTLETYGGDQVAVNFAQGCSLTTITKPTLVVVPSDAVYLWWNYIKVGADVVPQSFELVETVKENLDKHAQQIDTLMPYVSKLDILSELADKGYVETSISPTSGTNSYHIYQNTYRSPSPNTGASNGRAVYKDISSHKGKLLRVTPQEGASAYFAFITVVPVSGASPTYATGTTLTTITTTTTVKVPNVDGALYLWHNTMRSAVDVTPAALDIMKSFGEAVDECYADVGMRTYYVSADGDDSNSGTTSSSPFATVAHALQVSGKDVRIVIQKDIYEAVNLSVQKNSIRITGGINSQSRIINGVKMEATADENYEDVYSWTPSDTSVLPTGNNQWLWQHDIEDESTLIDIDERHPLHMGRRYRRQSTKLVHAESLSELRSSEIPCWYKSSNTLYVKAVAGSDIEEHPIYIPQKDAYGINIGSIPNVVIQNLQVLYSRINLASALNTKIIDCSARYSCGEGAFKWDKSRGVTFIRCEADSNTMPGATTGDGFNAHSYANSGVAGNTDAKAKHSTATLIDCWSHDNRDDGYSTHERCETSIIGGLFEYNGKGGLTPATGAHDTYNGVTCRKQSGAGIYYTVETTDAEGGVGGDVHCVNCLCIDNGGSNYRVGSGSATHPNRMTLVNCVSVRAGEYGYNSAGVNSKIVCYNCTDFGSQTSKSSNVVSYNGTLI